MGQLAATMLKTERRRDRPEAEAPPDQRRALGTIRSEARAAGAALSSGGKGGLPSTLVLGVMRRDGYRCKACGSNGKKRGGLGIHHKGGITESEWLKNKGHLSDRNNLVTICAACHDRIHEEARDEGEDGGG